jgi:hypothetical protein
MIKRKILEAVKEYVALLWNDVCIAHRSSIIDRQGAQKEPALTA